MRKTRTLEKPHVRETKNQKTRHQKPTPEPETKTRNQNQKPETHTLEKPYVGKATSLRNWRDNKMQKTAVHFVSMQ